MTFDPTYEPREGLTHRDADWSGIEVLVVGLGVSGFAAADALAERGARVTAVSRDGAVAVVGAGWLTGRTVVSLRASREGARVVVVSTASGGGDPRVDVAGLERAGDGSPRVTLVESDARKCAFLRTAVRELSLDVDILDQRAEEAEPQAADVVSARALAPLPRLLPMVARHLVPGGTAILPKGRGWEAEVEDARAGGWSFAVEPRASATDPQARILVLTELAHG